MNRRQLLASMFGVTVGALGVKKSQPTDFIINASSTVEGRFYDPSYPYCPPWLEKLLLADPNWKQIKETRNFQASAKGIVERLLIGTAAVNDVVDMQLSSSDCVNNEYFRGIYDGLLMAQAFLQDSDYHPINDGV
jgi:hypothetical protein